MFGIKEFVKVLWWFLTGRIGWGNIPDEKQVHKLEDLLNQYELFLYQEEKNKILLIEEKQKCLLDLKRELRSIGLRTPKVTYLFYQLIEGIEIEE